MTERTKFPDTRLELDDDGIELLSLIRRRIEQGRPMADIAKELGVSVERLCNFCMTYREPRHVVRYQGKARPAISITASPMIRDSWSSSRDAQRFANWRRAKKGAAEALER